MRQWQRTAQVIGYIQGQHFPYPKLQLLSAYIKLVGSAFANRFFGTSNQTFTLSLMGFQMTFRNYSEFVSLFEEIFVYQSYNFHSEKVNPVIVDGGANIGLAAMYFKKCFPQCQVMCFEPERENLELLRINVRQNKLQDININEYALSNEDGFASLYTKDELGSINSSLYASETRQFTQQIACRRLSDLLTEPIDMLKLDIEGSEERVIEDLVITQKINLVRAVVFEHHPSITRTATEKLIATLNSNGFLCHCTESPTGYSEKLVYCVRQ